MLRILNFLTTFIASIFTKFSITSQMVKRELKVMYYATFLGLFWALINPLIWAIVLAVVFSSGLRGASNAGEVPRIVWFITGMAAWNFFSQMLGRGTGVFLQFSYIIKKVKFNSALFITVLLNTLSILHLLFMVIVLVILLFNGYYPTLYWFQLLYYMGSAYLLGIGMALIFGSLSVFFRDIIQIIQIICQVGFWLTPIFWPAEVMINSEQWWLKWTVYLNPASYLVNGYRNAMVTQAPLWGNLTWTLSFWGVTLLVLLFGSHVYLKSSKHFVDVL